MGTLLWQYTGRKVEGMLSISQARKGKDVNSLEGALPTCPCVARKMPSGGRQTGSASPPPLSLPAESPGEDPWPLTVHVFICRLRIQQECELKGVSRVRGTVGSLPPLGQVPLGLALPTSARSAKASRDCCGPQQPESEAQVGPQEGGPDLGVLLIRGRGQTP